MKKQVIRQDMFWIAGILLAGKGGQEHGTVCLQGLPGQGKASFLQVGSCSNLRAGESQATEESWFWFSNGIHTSELLPSGLLFCCHKWVHVPPPPRS